MQLRETLMVFYSAFPSTWLKVIKTVMQHLTYIKSASKSLSSHKKVVWLFVLFSFQYIFFFYFSANEKFNYHSEILVPFLKQQTLQIKWTSEKGREGERKNQMNCLPCSLALVNTRRKKRRENSYENYTNYRYRFDICGYVSQHRRSVQSMYGVGSVVETVSSFQVFFPQFSIVLCWLCLRLRFVFPMNEHTHRTQWALIEIVLFW